MIKKKQDYIVSNDWIVNNELEMWMEEDIT